VTPFHNRTRLTSELTGRGDYIQLSYQTIKLRKRLSALRSNDLSDRLVITKDQPSYLFGIRVGQDKLAEDRKHVAPFVKFVRVIFRQTEPNNQEEKGVRLDIVDICKRRFFLRADSNLMFSYG
jgi:hypothetical protein